jgi:hypothetical protein
VLVVGGRSACVAAAGGVPVVALGVGLPFFAEHKGGIR